MKNYFHFIPLLSSLLKFKNKHGTWHARMPGRSFFSAESANEAIRLALVDAGVDVESDEL